jgi:lipopolysaccharide export system permease protein
LLTTFLAVNTVYILPTSFGVYKNLQFKLRNSIPTILLRDGVFIEVVDDMTMFIGSRDDNDIMRDLFIHDARITDRIITMTAQSGEFIERDGSPTLILQNGERSERNAEGQSGAVLLFDTHSVTITRNSSQQTERATIDINEDSISNLLSPDAAHSPQYYLQRHAEGHYRIASPWLGTRPSPIVSRHYFTRSDQTRFMDKTSKSEYRRLCFGYCRRGGVARLGNK